MTSVKALHKPLTLLVVIATALLLAACPSTPRRGGPPSVDRAEALARSGDHGGRGRRLRATRLRDDRQRSARNSCCARRAPGSRPTARPKRTGSWPPSRRGSPSSRPSNRVCCASSRRWSRDVVTRPGARSAPCRLRRRQPRRHVTTKPASRWPSPPGISSMASVRSWRANASSLPATRTIARSELLAQLRAAAERGVALTPPPGSDATVRGWLEAATVAADNARNPTLGAARLAAFRTRFPAHPALSALASEPGVGIEEQPAQLARGAARRAAAAAHRAHLGARRADTRRLHDRVLPAAREHAAAPARLRHRAAAPSPTSSRTRSPRAREFIVGPLTREEVVAAADLLIYPAAGAGAQFPAARPAGARALLPVRAFARRRCARRRALRQRQRAGVAAWCSRPMATGATASPPLSMKSCAPRAATRSARRATTAAAQRFRATASCRCCAPTTAARATSASSPPSARSSSSSRAAGRTSSSSSRRASPARHACCGRSCAFTSRATSRRTRSATPTTRTPPRTRRSTASCFPTCRGCSATPACPPRYAKPRAAFGDSRRAPWPPVRVRLRRIPHREFPAARRAVNPQGLTGTLRIDARDACGAGSTGCASRVARCRMPVERTHRPNNGDDSFAHDP